MLMSRHVARKNSSSLYFGKYIIIMSGYWCMRERTFMFICKKNLI